MDFNDTPEEAKFRAEVRAWLEANAKPKDPNKARAGRSNKAEADRLASARVWQAKKPKPATPQSPGRQSLAVWAAHQYNRSFIRRKNRISKYPAGFSISGWACAFRP